MRDLIENFPNQLKEAVEIGQQADLKPLNKEVDAIVAVGMGGSGIGGKLVGELIREELSVPYLTNADYYLPGFVCENTLLLVSSYSGNTEETIDTLLDGMKRYAQAVCFTTGGTILQLAQEHDLSSIVVPGGLPPRAALGYSVVVQLAALNKLGFILDHSGDLNAAADLLTARQSDIIAKAQEIAKTLKGKLPVIYCDSAMEAVALRFRQQLNENAKVLASHAVFPELNHNEIVGWTLPPDGIVNLILRTEGDYPRNKARIDISKQIFEPKASEIIELYPEGESRVQQIMYLTHLVDWITYYLCLENDQDPMAIDAIDFLKNELAKN